MNKIEAIKIVKDKAKLGLKEAKDPVEEIIPFLQLNKDELQIQLNVIHHRIDIFGTWASMEKADVSRLLALMDERDSLINKINNMTTCTRSHVDY